MNINHFVLSLIIVSVLTACGGNDDGINNEVTEAGVEATGEFEAIVETVVRAETVSNEVTETVVDTVNNNDSDGVDNLVDAYPDDSSRNRLSFDDALAGITDNAPKACADLFSIL